MCIKTKQISYSLNQFRQKKIRLSRVIMKNSAPRNRQKMMLSGHTNLHYEPILFLAPESFKMGLLLAPEIVNITKRTFMFI